MASCPGKPPKGSGRKISLPWFRQASMGERLGRLTSLRRGRTKGLPGSASLEVSE